MTADPIEAICEEMKRELFNDPGTPMWIRGQVCEWAARLRAFWSPQRKAFHEAALAFQYRWNLEQEVMTSEDLEVHQRFDAAYRALCESEKK